MVGRLVRRGIDAASGFDFPVPIFLQNRGRAALPIEPRATPVRPLIEEDATPGILRWSSDAPPRDARALEREAFQEWEGRGGFSMQAEQDAMLRAGGYDAPLARLAPEQTEGTFASALIEANPEIAAALLVQRFNAVQNLDQLGQTARILKRLVDLQTTAGRETGRTASRASTGSKVGPGEASGVVSRESLGVSKESIDEARFAMISALRRMNIDVNDLSGEQQKLIRPLLPGQFSEAVAGETGAARLAPAVKQNIISRTGSAKSILDLEQVRTDLSKLRAQGEINDWDYRTLNAQIENRHSGLVYDLAGGGPTGLVPDLRGGYQTARPMGVELVATDLSGVNKVGRFAEAIATSRSEDELAAVRALWTDEGFDPEIVQLFSTLENRQAYRVTTSAEKFANMQYEFGWARKADRTGRTVSAAGEQNTIGVGEAPRGVPIAIREIAGIGNVDVAGVPLRGVEPGGLPRPTGITDDVIKERPPLSFMKEQKGKQRYQPMTLRQPIRRAALRGLETEGEETARLRTPDAETRMRYQQSEDDYLDYALNPETGSIWKIKTEAEFGDWANRLEAAEDSGRYSENAIMMMREALEDMYIAGSRGPLWTAVPQAPVKELGAAVEQIPFGSYSSPEVRLLDSSPQYKGFAGRAKALAEEANTTIYVGSVTDTNIERAIAQHLDEFDLYYKTDLHRLGHTSSQIDTVVEEVVGQLNNAAARTGQPVTINGTGNSIDRLKGTQQEANNYASRILEAILNHPDRRFEIGQVVSGGQTGYEIAFANAARRLGLPVRIDPAVTQSGRPMVHEAKRLKKRPNITQEQWKAMSVSERKSKYGTADWNAFDFDGLKTFRNLDEYMEYMGLNADPFA